MYTPPVNSAPTGGCGAHGVQRSGGSVLTADTSSLADADGLGALSYEWKADGVTISGATGASYTLTQAEVGKAIYGFCRLHGHWWNNRETVDSAASAVVASTSPSYMVEATSVTDQFKVIATTTEDLLTLNARDLNLIYTQADGTTTSAEIALGDFAADEAG